MVLLEIILGSVPASRKRLRENGAIISERVKAKWAAEQGNIVEDRFSLKDNPIAALCHLILAMPVL